MLRKLGRAQKALMLEAARRWLRTAQSCCGSESYHVFLAQHNEKGMTCAWTGLGTKSDYQTVINAGLMRHTECGYTHGQVIWWRMTDKGASLVQDWIHSGLCLGHFDDSVSARYAIDSIIEACRQGEREKSCTG